MIENSRREPLVMLAEVEWQLGNSVHRCWLHPRSHPRHQLEVIAKDDVGREIHAKE